MHIQNSTVCPSLTVVTVTKKLISDQSLSVVLAHKHTELCHTCSWTQGLSLLPINCSSCVNLDVMILFPEINITKPVHTNMASSLSCYQSQRGVICGRELSCLILLHLMSTSLHLKSLSRALRIMRIFFCLVFFPNLSQPERTTEGETKRGLMCKYLVDSLKG